ncbi:MAG: glycosyltransferase family 39 protein [Nanoarchaeota archaeon]
MQNRKKLFILIVILFILITFTIRLVPLRTSHWWDETVYLQNAEIIYSGSESYNEWNFRPPLLSILITGIFYIWHNVFVVSILIALICTLLPIFAYLIGNELYDKKTGIIAAIITAFTPFIVLNSNYIMTDVPAITLASISFYFLIKKNNSNINNLLSGAFLALAILMKFTSLVIIPIYIIYFIINKKRLEKIIYFISGFSVVLMPYLLWVHITQGYFLELFIKSQKMVTDNNENLFYYLKNIANVFTYIVFAGVIAWIIKSRKKRIDIVFISWIIIFILYLSINPHKELRYAIPIILPLSLISARGMGSLINNKNRNYTIPLLSILFLLSFYPSLNNIINEPFIYHTTTDEIEASSYIKNNYNNITIYTHYNYPVFAYYTQLKTLKIDKNNINPGIFIIYNNSEYMELTKDMVIIKKYPQFSIYEYLR